MSSVVNLSENQVKQLLNWSLVCDAVEQAFRSVGEAPMDNEHPISKQPTRSHTVTEKGMFCRYFFSAITKKTSVNKYTDQQVYSCACPDLLAIIN